MRASIDFSRRRREEGCLSDLLLDQLVIGELAARPDRAAIDAHLASCPDCAARFDEINEDRARLRPLLDAGRKRHEEAARKAAARPKRRWLFAVTPLLAAAVVLVFLMPRWREVVTERIKGAATPLSLEVAVRHRDGSVEHLLPGGRVRPGDRVRFIVSTTRAGHLAILGLDAAGKVSVYVTDGAGRGPREIDRGARQVMPGSIQLDDTLGAERLVAVWCDVRFDLATAVDAGRRQLDAAGRDPRRAGPLGLPGCAEAAMVMDKRE